MKRLSTELHHQDRWLSSVGTCLVQLAGSGLTPFVMEMQNLLLAALFRPLNQRLSITQCLIKDVSTPNLCLHRPVCLCVCLLSRFS